LAAIASKLGHIPTVADYHEAMGVVAQAFSANPLPRRSNARRTMCRLVITHTLNP
jgi:hypothetical protein